MRAIGKNSISSVLGCFFTIVWGGILVALVLAIGFVVAGENITAWIDSNGMPSLEGPGSNISIAVPVTGFLESDVRVQDVHGVLHLKPSQDGLRRVNSAIAIASIAGFLWVLGQFRALLRALTDNQPFASLNAVRVRRIGWSVIVGELARSTIVYFESRYAATHFPVEGLRLDANFEVHIAAIVCGLMVLVLAEVLREGIRLYDEQSLTV